MAEFRRIVAKGLCEALKEQLKLTDLFVRMGEGSTSHAILISGLGPDGFVRLIVVCREREVWVSMSDYNPCKYGNDVHPPFYTITYDPPMLVELVAEAIQRRVLTPIAEESHKHERAIRSEQAQ